MRSILADSCSFDAVISMEELFSLQQPQSTTDTHSLTRSDILNRSADIEFYELALISTFALCEL